VDTDREIYREREDDYYADSVHVTEGGGLGINCGGMVYVKPLREWHRLAAESETAEIALLRKACDAAFAFIDSHVADPDITW